MAYRVEIKPSAASAIRSFARDVQARIVGKITQLSDNPRPQGVRKLQGGSNLYRVRVGSYRIIYAIIDDPPQVWVATVADRKDAYR